MSSGNKHSFRWVALLIATLMLAAQPIQPAYAATLTVTGLGDTVAVDGQCTLREALQAANTNADVNECVGAGAYGADVIDLTGMFGTITLTAGGGGDLNVTGAGGLTINGPGSGTLTISGGGIDRVFNIAAGSGNTVINDVTIANGNIAGGSGGGILNLGNTTLNRVNVQNNTSDFGGGIRNEATMVLNDVRVTGNNTNAAGSGGGISNRDAAANLTINRSTIDNNGGAGNSAGGGINNSNGATLRLTNSTISGNRSSVGGGGILNPSAATMILNDVTITGNSGAAGAGDGGGGVYLITGGTYTATNTIIAGNNDPNLGENDCAGGATLATGGYNMIGLDPTRCDGGAAGTWGANIAVASDLPGVSPTLGGLALNAPGLTPTHALNAGSRGIDEGGNCQATEQRTVTRPQDGDATPGAVCDIGAYERLGLTDIAVTLTDTPDPVAPNGTISFTLTVINNGGTTVAGGLNVTANLDGTLVNLGALPAGCAGALPAITCTTAAALASGGTASWTFTADDVGSASGTILNHSASVPVQAGEVNTADNTVNTTTTVNVVVPVPPAAGGGGGGGGQVLISDPVITKNGSPLNAVVGERVVWTVLVSNPGPYPTANVTIQDPIPGMFDIVSVDVTPTTRNNVTVNGNNVVADLGVFQPGESATITIVTIANSQAQAGEICNSAYIGSIIATACIMISPDALPPTGGSPLHSWAWLGQLMVIVLAVVVVGIVWFAIQDRAKRAEKV